MVIVRWLVGLLLLLVFGLFAFVVWLAVNEDVVSDNGEPPLIKAEGLPFKVEPEERGGIAVMNEDSSLVQALDRGTEEPVVERILPAPEPPPRSAAEVLPQQPATTAADTTELPASPGIQADQFASIEPEPIAPVVVEALESPEPPSEVTPIDPVVAAVEPNGPVPTPVPAPPVSGIPEPTSELPRVFAGPSAQGNGGVVTLNGSAPGRSVVEGATASIRPTVIEPPPSTPEAETAPTEPAPAEVAVIEAVTPPTGASDRFRIQLSALREEVQAEQSWTQLRGQFPSVLAGAQVFIERSETDRGVFYRVQAGLYETREDATSGCDAIKALGGDCFVVRGPN